MALFRLKFKDAEVDVLVIRQAETYGGILEGKLSSKLNSRVIERAKEKAEFLWPNVTVLSLAPDATEMKLPAVQCLSLLEQISGSNRTRLVLLHFENDVRIHLSDATTETIGGIEWSALVQSNGH